MALFSLIWFDACNGKYAHYSMYVVYYWDKVNIYKVFYIHFYAVSSAKDWQNRTVQEQVTEQ